MNIEQMQDVGIRVEISEEEIEHFAIIDHSLDNEYEYWEE